MTAIVCALLSAVAFYLSLGLGSHWWLLWIAPVPVLWLAFGESKPWVVLVASWAVFAIGLSNLMRAYAGIMPLPVLVLYPTVPGLLFALAAIGSQQVRRTLGPIPVMLAFAALWTADLLVSVSGTGGAGVSPAAAEVSAPVLVQSAALVGFCGVTFLIGAVSAGLAVGLSPRRWYSPSRSSPRMRLMATGAFRYQRRTTCALP